MTQNEFCYWLVGYLAGKTDGNECLTEIRKAVIEVLEKEEQRQKARESQQPFKWSQGYLQVPGAYYGKVNTNER